jgi:hypothetical protein
MKGALIYALMGLTVVSLSSCGNFATSLNSQNFDPDLNPLDSPGSRNRNDLIDSDPQFAPGSWVEVTDPNAAIYRRVPRDNEQPDYSLRPGTPLKIIGGQGTYVKVETESGQIGYVPAIMVGTKPTGNDLPLVSPEPNDFPSSIDPIDPINPTESVPPIGSETLDPLPSLPPVEGDAPFVAPEPEVPPISVEDAPKPSGPVIPPDPLDDTPVEEE